MAQASEEQTQKNYLVCLAPFDHADGTISGESWHMVEAESPEAAISRLCGRPEECIVIDASHSERFGTEPVSVRVPLKGARNG